MSKYYDNLNKLRKEYFNILSPVFPEWLLDYIDTPEIQRLSGISMVCGTDYSKIYNYKAFNSTLDHSVGVALIIWNFTKNKKQTLAGLFHDIATPTFKHCIDFMNGDSEHQESTEERTEEIIKNSKTIMNLLDRDGIMLKEVSDYHIYPIADNDTPRLSADRFEYNFSNGLFLYNAWNLDEISKYYNDITVLKNEDGVEELGFKTPQICKEYLHAVLNICANYDNDNMRTVMQFFADIVKSMNVKGYITVDDLYELSEEDVINKVLNCNDTYIRESFNKFQNATSVYGSEMPVNNKYCISVKGKKRYIVPLTYNDGKAYRINQIDETAHNEVQNYMNLKRSKYTGFDFEFNPYYFKSTREDDSLER